MRLGLGVLSAWPPEMVSKLAPLVALALSLSTATAFAQDRAPLDVAQAETLFREGRSLMDQGRPAEACPKLAESHRLAPGGGTVLTLALCYEAAGKLASAWATFFEASRFASRDGRDDRRKIAQDHIAQLEPDLSRMVVTLPSGLDPQQVSLSLDGQPLSPAVVGVATPVDPGKHTLRVSSPGKQPFDRSFEVGPRKDRVELTIPPLQDALPPSSSPSPGPSSSLSSPPSLAPPPPPPEPSSVRKPLGIGLLAGGAVGLGLGAFLAVRARSVNDEALSLCPQSPCSDQAGLQKNRDARSLATFAGVAAGLGLAGAAVGGYLLLTAPGKPQTALVVRPSSVEVSVTF